MKSKVLDVLTSAFPAATLSAALLALAPIAPAQSTDTSDARASMEHATHGQSARWIEGAWSVEVTIRSCDNGAPVFTPFRVMNLFNRGGTLVETHSGIVPGGPPFAGPGERSVGLGTWNHLGGRTYDSVFSFFLYLPDGAPAGMQTVARKITVRKAGREFNSDATFQVRDPAGNTLFAACATESATRMN